MEKTITVPPVGREPVPPDGTIGTTDDNAVFCSRDAARPQFEPPQVKRFGWQQCFGICVLAVAFAVLVGVILWWRGNSWFNDHTRALCEEQYVLHSLCCCHSFTQN